MTREEEAAVQQALRQIRSLAVCTWNVANEGDREECDDAEIKVFAERIIAVTEEHLSGSNLTGAPGCPRFPLAPSTGVE